VRRTITFGAGVALLVASIVGFLANPAVASSKAGARAGGAGAIAQHSSSVRLAGTVNVARLPRLSPSNRGAFRIPLRRGPGSSAGAASASPGGAPAVAGPSVAVTPGTPLSGTLGDGDNGSVAGVQLTPPDMGFAANGTKEVEFVNVVGKIWTGTTPGTAFSLANFFSPGSTRDFLSDPWIKWDAGSGRFFAGIFDVSLGGEIMAVSQTSDPGGTWFLYRIRYPSTAGGITAGGCPDQGKGGVDSNVVGLGFNEFSTAGTPGCPSSATFQGAGLEVFNKSQMVAGATVNFVFTDPLPQYFSLVPADSLTSSATTEYFASLNSGTGTALHRVTSVGVPPGTVNLTALADITVKSYSNPPGASQKGTTTKINTGDDRTQNVVTLGTMMTVTQAVGCVPSGDTTKRSCGRVYEVNNGTSTLKVLRTIAAAGTYFFYPAATLVGPGTVGVSIGRSSSTTFGSLYTTAGTWGGTLAAPVQVQAGTAANTTKRYGDYFAAAPQPGTTNQIWAAGEIGGTSGTTFKWNTSAAPVTVP
jgi:hypothetical protein